VLCIWCAGVITAHFYLFGSVPNVGLSRFCLSLSSVSAACTQYIIDSEIGFLAPDRNMDILIYYVLIAVSQPYQCLGQQTKQYGVM
jgi:hypothetical protein